MKKDKEVDITDTFSEKEKFQKMVEAVIEANKGRERFNRSGMMYFDELTQILKDAKDQGRLPRQRHKPPFWAKGKKNTPKQDAAIKIIINKEES